MFYENLSEGYLNMSEDNFDFDHERRADSGVLAPVPDENDENKY